MNKRHIAVLLLFSMMLNYNTVFAEQKEYYDTDSFLTVLQIPEKENAIVLTLEEATQKALARSTTLKNSNMDLNISEQKLENEQKNIANGHTFQQLLEYIKQNANYTTSLLSRQVAEEGVKFSLKQVYIEIINQERIAF